MLVFSSGGFSFLTIVFQKRAAKRTVPALFSFLWNNGTESEVNEL